MMEYPPIDALLISGSEYEYVTLSQLAFDGYHRNRDVYRYVRFTRVTRFPEALRKLIERDYEVIIYDLSLTDGSGLDGLIALREVAKSAAIIVLSGTADDRASAFHIGVQDYLVKGLFDATFLIHSLNHSLERQREVNYLREEFERVSAASRARADFLSSIQRELCTPLAAIVGFTEMMLADDIPPEEQPTLLAKVLGNGNHLLRLVRSMLDLCSLSGPGLSTEQLSYSPIKVLVQVDQKVRKKAEKQGIKFAVRYQSSIPELIITDPDRLKQILLHFSGMALALVRGDSVELFVRCDPKAERLTFQLSYEGLPLDDESKNIIFDPYGEESRASTSAFREMALELAISRELAERLGGGLEIRSDSSGRNTFVVSVSTGNLTETTLIGEEQEVNVDLEPVVPQFNARVLLAEGSTDARETITGKLRQFGISVTWADNGHELLKLTRMTYFDLVLANPHLPMLDGSLASLILRRTGYSGSIVALTTNPLDETTQAHLSALGFDEVFVVPAKEGDYLSLLERHIDLNDPEVGTITLEQANEISSKYLPN